MAVTVRDGRFVLFIFHIPIIPLQTYCVKNYWQKTRNVLKIVVHLIKNMWKKVIKFTWVQSLTIVLVTVFIAAASVIVRPLEYKSTVKVMLIERQITQLDLYTAARGLERVAANLGKIVYTDSFFNKTLKTPIKVADNFGATETKRRENWQRKVRVSNIPGSSIMVVEAYDPNPTQSRAIAQAVSYVLTLRSQEYLGDNPNLQVKEIDSALTSTRPVRPDFIKTFILGLGVGILLAGLWVYWNWETVMKRYYRQKPLNFLWLET